jgi:hypothetical protein
MIERCRQTAVPVIFHSRNLVANAGSAEICPVGLVAAIAQTSRERFQHADPGQVQPLSRCSSLTERTGAADVANGANEARRSENSKQTLWRPAAWPAEHRDYRYALGNASRRSCGGPGRSGPR